jgi:hypothetical protein
MKRLLLILLAAAVTLTAADLSGRWTGTLEKVKGNPGGPQSDAHYLVLRQNGDRITGTAGPKADAQWEIRNGRVDGSRLTFEIAMAGGKMVLGYDLQVGPDGLAGKVEPKTGQPIAWKLQVKREP